MARAVQILPKRITYRSNWALYADYASDFQTGEREARAIQTPDSTAQLALAFSQLGKGQVSEAKDAYEKLGAMDAMSRSTAAAGLGDLATFEGRFSDAVRILSEGAATDVAAMNADRAAAKFAALAYAYLLRGQRIPAVAAADKALATSNAAKIRFLAARILIETGEIPKARSAIDALANEPQTESQAHAKILEGDAALKSGNPREAIKALTEANTVLDTWIAHFDLGRAYVEAGLPAQADSEFDRCIQRRGEALALFVDEEPTFGYLPPVYYYQGRVREELKTDAFHESYRVYLSMRGNSKEDSLLPEVRRRAGQ
jgi:tetratricopeptide (TPR) repeat protein